uniref:Peptidase A1 domain-containing protein n=1 Tax=Leersia perrieri TaxID=77586 RepID=A0A0D9WXM7_9ORYZ
MYSSLVLTLIILLSLPCTLIATNDPNQTPRPILVRISKDTSTSLYTIPIKTGSRLVLDLGGPLLSSTCLAAHVNIPCRSSVCAAEIQENRWNCSSPSSTNTNGAGRSSSSLCSCSAYPYNPLDGRCARGDVTTTPMLANATDGVNPLYPVAFPVHAACAPASLLGGSLASAGAVGVAGLSDSPLSLPSQVAASLGVARTFALCLPGGSGTGAAIFGGGPFRLFSVAYTGITSDLVSYFNITRNARNGRIYIDVVGIAVNQRGADVSPESLALDAVGGRGGVMISTVAPYTVLRPDIYRAVIDAVDAELAFIPRMPASPPFERCFDAWALGSTRVGPPLSNVDFTLRHGGNLTFLGANTMVQVNERTLCFAFVEMGPTTPVIDGSPAVIIGGYQLENQLLVFDLEKGIMGSSGLLFWIRTTCSNFDFSWGIPRN